MRILISNDDGIWAEGIKHLSRALEKIGEVWVVAPERQKSASGLGITVHKPLRAEEVKYKNSNVKAFAVNGTPSDCVKLGVQALMDKPPHIVVTGINHGPNLGTDVLYSGTVSGAIEGVINGVPSVAVSLATWDEPEFVYAAKFAADIVKKVVESGLPNETLININVPAVPESEIKGVKVTKLGKRRYENIFHPRKDPRGRLYFWMAGEVVDLDSDPESDVVAVKEGYISLTPIQLDITDHKMITELKKWYI